VEPSPSFSVRLDASLFTTSHSSQNPSFKDTQPRDDSELKLQATMRISDGLLLAHLLPAPDPIRTRASSVRLTRRTEWVLHKRGLQQVGERGKGSTGLRGTLSARKHRSIVTARNLQSHGGECVPSQMQTALTCVPVSCRAVGLGLAARGAGGADLHRGFSLTRSVSPAACLVARAALVRRDEHPSDDGGQLITFKLFVNFRTLFRKTTLIFHEHKPVRNLHCIANAVYTGTLVHSVCAMQSGEATLENT
jgi:hypothetical protein